MITCCSSCQDALWLRDRDFGINPRNLGRDKQDAINAQREALAAFLLPCFAYRSVWGSVIRLTTFTPLLATSTNLCTSFTTAACFQGTQNRRTPSTTPYFGNLEKLSEQQSVYTQLVHPLVRSHAGNSATHELNAHMYRCTHVLAPSVVI